MAQMSMPSPRSLWNAIFVPSGEKAGAPLVPAEVSACLLLPSLDMTQTWPGALPGDERAVRREHQPRVGGLTVHRRVMPVPAGVIE